MKAILIAGITLATIIAGGIVCQMHRHPAPKTDQKVAVFGRTLFPTPPPVINKRTSLSGEGQFIRTRMDK